MKRIENRYITFPGDQGDGLTLCDGDHYCIQNCVIDFSDRDLDEIDEAIGITWGCSAEVRNCVFRGAGKLVLCGSGDRDKMHLEKGRLVTFSDCLFENFSRRGPEVQDGMRVTMERCVIRNWGDPDRFLTRSFGAWAHGQDSMIHAVSCVFWQDRMFTRHAMKDLVNHIGQAYNDTGIKGLFSRDAWRPGNWRGLVASDGGFVEGQDCFVNHWWITVENTRLGMSQSRAYDRIADLENMRDQLLRDLQIPTRR